MADPVTQLADAARAMSPLVAGIAPGQWAALTPCEQWTVADLLRHVVGGNRLFAAAARQQQAAPPTGPDDVPETELPAAYEDSVHDVVEAFGLPGALDRGMSVPFGTVPGSVALHLRLTEFLVHGWDLAQATGQPTDFPEALAEQELAFSQAALSQLPPDRRPFAAPQPVPATAPALDRLAALLGRRVPVSRSGV